MAQPLKKLPKLEDVPPHWRWVARLVRAALVFRNRRRLLRTDRDRIPVLESTIETLYIQTQKAQQGGFVHRERLMNACLFIMVFERDLAVLREHMTSTLQEWPLQFAARQMTLLTFEASDDIPHILGKDFRETLRFLEVSQTDVNGLGEQTKMMSRWRQNNFDFLNTLRNVCVGHREHDVVAVLESIRAVEPLQVFAMTADFYSILKRINDLLLQFVIHSGKIDLVLKQVVTSSERKSVPLVKANS